MTHTIILCPHCTTVNTVTLAPRRPTMSRETCCRCGQEFYALHRFRSPRGLTREQAASWFGGSEEFMEWFCGEMVPEHDGQSTRVDSVLVVQEATG